MTPRPEPVPAADPTADPVADPAPPGPPQGGGRDRADGLVPPKASRRPHVLEAHGDRRDDDWYWLATREDPETLAYLQAENTYADALLEPLAELREGLFQEIRGRIVETDVSAPERSGAWWYWSRTEEGRQYGITCRLADPERRLGARDVLERAQAGTAGVEVVLDQNALATGHEYFSLGVFDVSPDHRLLAYATDVDGGERFQLRFRDLATGTDLADEIDDVQYGSAWATDNRTFFYVRPDEAVRPYQVWRHVLGQDPSEDALVFEEPDERFFVSVGLTRSERFVLIEAESKTTSYALAIEASEPAAHASLILPRRDGVEYDVDHAHRPELGDAWIVRTNAPSTSGEPSTNFAVRLLPLGARGWDELSTLLAPRPDVKVESVTAFAGHLVVGERHAGLERLHVLPLVGRRQWAEPAGDDHLIDQPDPVYSLSLGANPDFATTVLRFGYTSLVAPPSAVDYDLGSQERQVVRTQPVRGYLPDDYLSQRIWATAPDGVKVPISLVARRDQLLDGSAPCLLYGYGSYEITVDPTFSAARLNLLERGFVFAIAHVRGGGELGRQWYEDGKLGHKRNTFSDFVACADHLVAEGWTAPKRLVARGGSAGGLLMGAVTNERPDLWQAVVAEVPFVDVVTTMSDPDLPLTVTEWEEWGNPIEDAQAYAYMKSYSPYDNVKARDGAVRPALYVTGGLNDPRVGYWEPAKWVAKLRALWPGSRPIVLRTELGAGHQGPSGRYDAWRDEARVQAFILSAVGLAPALTPGPPASQSS